MLCIRLKGGIGGDRMEKKKRILISCLMALAVTASSSYAYFTNSAEIKGTGSTNLLLNITNGKWRN